jgi:hypothetical protein
VATTLYARSGEDAKRVLDRIDPRREAGIGVVLSRVLPDNKAVLHAGGRIAVVEVDGANAWVAEAPPGFLP